MFSLTFVRNVLRPSCNPLLYPPPPLIIHARFPTLSRRVAHIPGASSVDQDALGDASGQGRWATVRRSSSRTAANSSHLLERVVRLWRRILSRTMRSCPFPIFAGVKFWHRVIYSFLRGVCEFYSARIVCEARADEIFVAKTETPDLIRFSFVSLLKFIQKTVSACLFLFFSWRPGRRRHTANDVTFIFPLNLEHSSPPCRIQKWSLTFSLVPSLAWSHFLSIWFLAPYATFLFPACRQQGVALLSPSQSCLWMWEAIPFHSAIGRRRAKRRRRMKKRKKGKKKKEKHTGEHTEIDVGLLVQSKVRIFAFVEIFYSDLGII